VTARFDGGDITSDAGVLLVAHVDRKLGLIDALVDEIRDDRQAAKVRHPLAVLVRQRVLAIAAGYEDANDFDTLCHDPALKLACGRAPSTGTALGSQPTLSRLENGVDSKDIYCMAESMAMCVIRQLPRKTKQVIIDIDAYEDPCHGQQEFEFFNAHYGSHCYLPLALYVTGDDGVQRLATALLRSGKGGQAGVRAILRRGVALIRQRFPWTKIILRADAGFGNKLGLEMCDKLGISYCLGLSTNKRLQALSTKTQLQACGRYTFEKHQWQAEGVCRVFGRFEYKAGSWKSKRNVVVKAEITRGELNPRYVVTNLYNRSPEKAYAFYCGRGDIENRIKELKLDLFAGRTSCHRFLANQFRLLLHTAAAILMGALQEAVQGTALATAQAGTLRLRLIKLGARVIETTRRIWLHMSSSYPNQQAWSAAYSALAP
jgi:hypothetical protein